MDNDKFKVIELDGRKFLLNKMNPVTSLKLAKMILAKTLPGLECFFQSKDIIRRAMNAKATDMDKSKFASGLLDHINMDTIFEAIQKCLMALEDEDLEKVIQWSLTACHEILPAGNTPVLNPDGTYGAVGIEDDLFLIIMLMARELEFNFKSFFNDSRWNSLLKAAAADTSASGVPM